MKAARRSVGRLRAGERVFLVAALALFVFMFLGWYGSEVSGQVRNISFGAGGNAWQTLELISLILMLTVVVALGAAGLRLAGSKWDPEIPANATVAVLGGLSTLLVALRIVLPPDLGTLSGIAVEATLKLGAFLGLIAAAGVAYGGYRAMREEGSSFAKVADGLSRKPAGGRKNKPPVRKKKARS